jgi:hypothetical protein
MPRKDCLKEIPENVVRESARHYRLHDGRLYVSTCKVCCTGIENPDNRDTIDIWLTEGRTYEEILAMTKEELGLEISISSLKSHFSRHLSEELKSTRDYCKRNPKAKQLFSTDPSNLAGSLAAIRYFGMKNILSGAVTVKPKDMIEAAKVELNIQRGGESVILGVNDRILPQLRETMIRNLINLGKHLKAQGDEVGLELLQKFVFDTNEIQLEALRELPEREAEKWMKR